jgi:hypothetical protein
MIQYNVAYVIVLYNKTISESVTLNSIYNSGLDYSGSYIRIWNNGPRDIDVSDVNKFAEKGFLVDVRQTITNISLSEIYNTFISEVSSDKYVILDDDSNLNADYLASTLIASGDKLSVPIIYSDSIIVDPKIDGQVVRNSDESILYDDGNFNLMTIGSGIIIGHNICNLLMQSFGSVFDERFYFYGVDSSIFFRLNMVKKGSVYAIVPGFEHSLSRLSDESEIVKKFRAKERAYDLALQWRFYKPLHICIYEFVKITSDMLFRGRKEYSFLHLFKALLVGRHYKRD